MSGLKKGHVLSASTSDLHGMLEGATDDVAFDVFTTRPDTIFGATYMVVAPEHPLLQSMTSSEQREQVEAYVQAAAQKSDLERTELQKTKTGVFTGETGSAWAFSS